MTQVIPNWLGPFYGSETSFQDNEILTIQNIPRELLKEESALMRTKWFDYRRLHPLQATNYFMECYKQAYREFIRVAINAEAAPFVSPISEVEYEMKLSKSGKMTKKLVTEIGEDGVKRKVPVVLRRGLTFLDSRERLQFWELRQLADRLGMRYDFFMFGAMKWYAEEKFHRDSLHPPRPGHIKGNEELLVTVGMKWETELASRLQIAADPWYQVNSYSGHEFQIAYEKFVIAQVENRHHKRFSLCESLYKHNAIRVEEAIRHFGIDLTEDAMREAISLSR